MEVFHSSSTSAVARRNLAAAKTTGICCDLRKDYALNRSELLRQFMVGRLNRIATY